MLRILHTVKTVQTNKQLKSLNIILTNVKLPPTIKDVGEKKSIQSNCLRCLNILEEFRLWFETVGTFWITIKIQLRIWTSDSCHQIRRYVERNNLVRQEVLFALRCILRRQQITVLSSYIHNSKHDLFLKDIAWSQLMPI